MLTSQERARRWLEGEVERKALKVKPRPFSAELSLKAEFDAVEEARIAEVGRIVEESFKQHCSPIMQEDYRCRKFRDEILRRLGLGRQNCANPDCSVVVDGKDDYCHPTCKPKGEPEVREEG